MTQSNKPLGITEVVLRDAHQSILATRLRIEDMLPICEKLDQIGYWSIESWGVQHLMLASATWVKIHGKGCAY